MAREAGDWSANESAVLAKFCLDLIIVEDSEGNIGCLPIPPAPIKAIGLRFSARPITFSIGLS